MFSVWHAHKLPYKMRLHAHYPADDDLPLLALDKTLDKTLVHLDRVLCHNMMLLLFDVSPSGP